MIEPKTLNEAREQLEAATNQIVQLTARVAAFESPECLNASGIVLVTEPDGVFRFEVPQLKQYETQISILKEQGNQLDVERTALTQAANELKGLLAAANIRIAELEASQKTVSAQAREMLASQGGPPLAVDSQNALELTPDDYRKQLNSEKDPTKRFDIFEKLLAQEAKTKSRLNGKR